MSRPGPFVISNPEIREHLLENVGGTHAAKPTEELEARTEARETILAHRSVSREIAEAVTRRAAQQDRYRDGHYDVSGPVWWISLNHPQVRQLAAVLASGGGTLALMPGFQIIAGQLVAAAGYVEAMDEIGGRNGVTINGVLNTNGVVVTPHLGPLFEQMVQGARLGVSGRVITEFLVRAAAQSPVLAEALRIPVAAQVCGAVLSGTPLGWALAGALGLAVDLLMPSPSPNVFGAVHANRGEALDWESFWLSTLSGSDRVALLSWQGHFSAQEGGGGGVYANRPLVGAWETWKLHRNADGTVSFESINGHFLCAENGGGRECQANRRDKGDWESFFLINQPDGRVALRTKTSGQFVSVQGRG